MAPFRRYDDLKVGDVFPPEPLAFVVDRHVVEGFLAAPGDKSGLYDGSDGARRAPSMIASVYLIELLKARRSPPGGIHAKQAIRFHRPAMVGERLSIQARVVDKYVRKERPYMVAQFEARGSDGGLVSSGLITSIWGRDQ
jgi:3-hydroxybutyryl-CoA dehydratase